MSPDSGVLVLSCWALASWKQTKVHMLKYPIYLRSLSCQISQNIFNDFTNNIGVISNVRFATNRSNFYSFSVNANVTFLYPLPITQGIVKTVHVKNISWATRYMILPNSNNNKGANTIPVSNGTVATFTFVPYDTTAANVAATIIND